MHCTCHQQWSSNRSSTFRTCRHIDSISYLSHDWEWMKFSSSSLRTFFFLLVARWFFLGLSWISPVHSASPSPFAFTCIWVVVSFEAYQASASSSDFLAWVFNTLEGCVTRRVRNSSRSSCSHQRSNISLHFFLLDASYKKHLRQNCSYLSSLLF